MCVHACTRVCVWSWQKKEKKAVISERKNMQLVLVFTQKSILRERGMVFRLGLSEEKWELKIYIKSEKHFQTCKNSGNLVPINTSWKITWWQTLASQGMNQYKRLKMRKLWYGKWILNLFRSVVLSLGCILELPRNFEKRLFTKLSPDQLNSESLRWGLRIHIF